MCLWLPLLVVLGVALLYRWYRQSQTLEGMAGKYVFITGCDTGFGNLLAKQLDKRGMKVLAACLTEKGAENLRRDTSSRLQTLILDVSDSQSVQSAAKWASDIVLDSGLWGLVNNAGVAGAIGPNLWLTKEDFARTLNVNLLGLVDVTLNLAPLVIKARGRIVNVSSCLGRLASLGGGYCHSKFGVEAFSDSLRRELHDFGVKVSIIEPGYFSTHIADGNTLKGRLQSLWETVPENIKDLYGEQYCQQYIQNMISLIQTCSPKLYRVVNCMEHALTAAHPWTRYSPGWDCKLYYVPVSYLPTAISDYLLRSAAPKPALTLE